MKVLLDGPFIVPGDYVSLKEEPETVWEVVEVWPPIPRANIKRGWNNNI